MMESFLTNRLLPLAFSVYSEENRTGRPSPPLGSSFIVTESGEYLLTEAGEYLITESAL